MGVTGGIGDLRHRRSERIAHEEVRVLLVERDLVGQAKTLDLLRRRGRSRWKDVDAREALIVEQQIALLVERQTARIVELDVNAEILPFRRAGGELEHFDVALVGSEYAT